MLHLPPGAVSSTTTLTSDWAQPQAGLGCRRAASCIGSGSGSGGLGLSPSFIYAVTLDKSPPPPHGVGAEPGGQWMRTLPLPTHRVPVSAPAFQLGCIHLAYAIASPEQCPPGPYSTLLQEALPNHPPNSARSQSQIHASWADDTSPGTQDPHPNTWNRAPLCPVASSAQ